MNTDKNKNNAKIVTQLLKVTGASDLKKNKKSPKIRLKDKNQNKKAFKKTQIHRNFY